MRRCADNNPRITSAHGQATKLGHFKKHLGYDYLVKKVPVKGPIRMQAKSVTRGVVGGLTVEATDGTRDHRFLHLDSTTVKPGQWIEEGQQFAVSGNSGQVEGVNGGWHIHHDVRKAGTKWDESFYNYLDWEKLLAVEAAKPKLPPVDSKIQLIPVDTRNTYIAGTATPTGKQIHVTDNTFIYTIRGYDPKYPGRILINSKSAGGDGVALALYDVAGKVIPGWKTV